MKLREFDLLRVARDLASSSGDTDVSAPCVKIQHAGGAGLVLRNTGVVKSMWCREPRSVWLQPCLKSENPAGGGRGFQRGRIVGGDNPWGLIRVRRARSR
jgi:hypothetical protein